MIKQKTLKLSVLKLQRTEKGFTLIELLIVVSIIAILSTMILIALDSGRERAELNRYISYAVQMHRLAADVAAAGQFDSGKTSLTENTEICLSKTCTATTGLNETGGADMKKALTYLTKMPEATTENSQSPYNSSEGVTITYKPNGVTPSVVRIKMYLVGGADNGDFVTKKCKSIGWAVNAAKDSCYLDIKLHKRL